jgi:energy-coupling factor transport system ATP-binding protein
VVELARKLKLTPLPLSIEDAKTRINSPIAFEARVHPEVGDETLTVDNLSVDYGKHSAVQNVSLRAMAGEVVALMGPNGSGKSSLLWAIQGSGARSAGEVKTPSGDPQHFSINERLEQITMVPQRASDLLFLNTLADELSESDTLNEVTQGETAKLFLQLSNRTDPKQHPRDLSAGQQLALVLSVQLVKGARLVLLDEPTRGLDYEAKRHLVSAIKLVQSSGRTVLVASHDIEFVAQIADRVYLLENGEITLEGDTVDVLGPAGKLPTQVAQIAGQPGLLLAEQVVAIEN